HAVVAHAQEVDLRDPVDAEQLVINVDGGEVAQVDVVVATVRRVEVDDVQDVGRLLADGDPLVLNRGRQLRQGQLHAVLDQDQGRVQVGADVEGDGQGVGAVVAHLRRHVQHALDAVDLLLDRRRHRVGHHLGAGPRVADGYRDGGGRDLRVLRQWQRPQGNAARQGNEDRQHRGEDRAVNEKARDHG